MSEQSQHPTVTVLMAVFNEADFVVQAVESICQQTWADFELLIIDDGSQDASVDLIRAIADPRIKLHCQGQNQGLSSCLHWGVQQAQGDYIARMDADDMALPTRLEQQVQQLTRHPTVGLVGSGYTLINERGEEATGYSFPSTDVAIRWLSLLGNPFAHPTVMLRRSLLVQHQLNYDPSLPAAQDYDLWTRLLHHTQGMNLPDPLVRYRLRSGITHTKRQAQLRCHDAIALRTIQATLPGMPISIEQVSQLRSLVFGGNWFIGDRTGDPSQLSGGDRWAAVQLFLQLFRAFLKLYRDHRRLDEVKQLAGQQFQRLALQAPRLNGWPIFLSQFLLLHPEFITQLSSRFREKLLGR